MKYDKEGNVCKGTDTSMQLKGHTHGVNSLSVTSDSTKVATASLEDPTWRIFNINGILSFIIHLLATVCIILSGIYDREYTMSNENSEEQ